MFDLVRTHIAPLDKKCFSIHTYNKKINDEVEITRLSFTKFIDEESFTTRSKCVAYNDYAKQKLTGRTFNAFSLVVANDFEVRGKPVDKQLLEFIRNFSKKNNYQLYPSHNIPDKLFQLIENSCWTSEVDIPEGDYASLLYAIASTRDSLKIWDVYLDLELDKVFHNALKLQNMKIVQTPENSIYITDKFIDDAEAKRLVALKPKVIVNFDDACIDNLGDNQALGRLYQAGIHLIPPGITKIGNSLIAEGFAKELRQLEESFKLIETNFQRCNKIWQYAMHTKENFSAIVNEIVKAGFDTTETDFIKNRHKLETFGVGANSYKA